MDLSSGRSGCVGGSGRPRLRGEQGLDGATLVHGAVALGGLVEGEGEVEDLARFDLAAGDEVDQVGQEAPYRGGAAVEVDVGEEQRQAGQGDVVGDPHVADVPAGAGRVDRLHHRFLGADGLD